MQTAFFRNRWIESLVFLKKEKILNLLCFQDTHRENAPSNKTEALTKSMNICISVVGTLNQLFVRGSHNEKIFLKKIK